MATPQEDTPTPPPTTEDTTTAATTMEESTATTTEAAASTKKEVPTMQDVKKAFQTFGASSSRALKQSMESMKRNAQEITKKVPDDYSSSVQEGLEQLKTKVELAKASEKKNPAKWDFASVPAALFDKTLDDVLVAFVKWAKVEDDSKFNITKAFSRLESYASWMHANAANLENVTTESVADAWAAWKFQVSHDKQGRLVWWVNVTAMDLPAVKARDAVDSLRMFVWLAHVILLDAQAQENGMLLVENMGKIQFWNGMTLVPPKLSLKLDRLTIGVLPIKVKHLYMCQCPVWCDVLVKMMKPFVSKKIKSRIQVVQQDDMLEEELGKECIPVGFASCDGTLAHDEITKKYFGDLTKDETKKENAETAQL